MNWTDWTCINYELVPLTPGKHIEERIKPHSLSNREPVEIMKKSRNAAICFVKSMKLI